MGWMPTLMPLRPPEWGPLWLPLIKEGRWEPSWWHPLALECPPERGPLSFKCVRISKPFKKLNYLSGLSFRHAVFF